MLFCRNVGSFVYLLVLCLAFQWVCASIAEAPAGNEATVADAVDKARKQTAGLPDFGWTQLQKMAVAARILAEQGHGGTLSGQITCRDELEDGSLAMWTGKYGIPFEILTVSDFLLIDEKLEVRKGEGFPNMATRFHLHVYRKRPDIECIVHTHPPAASSLGMTGQPLMVSNMDVMVFYEDVQHLKNWPGIPFGDEEGEIISGVLGDHWAALLAHHGIIVAGRSLEEATYRAYFFEEAAKMQLNAMSAAQGMTMPEVDPELGRAARDWRVSPGPVRAHFNAWATLALRKGHQDALVQSHS